MGKIQMIWPVKLPKITQNFHGNFIMPNGRWAYTRNGEKDKHRAFDLIMSNRRTKGADVLACYDGVIERVTSNYGVFIRHEINGKIYFSVYWHLLDISVYAGQKVLMGDVIGHAGGDPKDKIPDGGPTTAAHVHFLIKKGSNYSKAASIDLLDINSPIEMVRIGRLKSIVSEFARKSVEKAIATGYMTKWDNPREPVTKELIEWIFINMKIFEREVPKGFVTKEEFAFALDRLGLLD